MPNKKLSAIVIFVSGFALAIMLGQTSRSGSTIEQRMTDVERRLTAVENRLAQNAPAALDTSKKKKTVTNLSSADLAEYLGSADAQVLADDGTFLGDLTNRFGLKSIGNDVGQHGSTVATKSMYNTVGQYGGSVGQYSPFNEVCTHPPKLLFHGEFVCFVTVNTTKSPRVNPDVLRVAVRGE